MRLIPCLFLLALGCSPLPPPDDYQRLAGVWKVTESWDEHENAGRPFDLELHVQENNIYRHEGDREEKEPVWRFVLKENTDPREIDLEILQGPNKGQIHRGIYELGKNDRHLRIAIQRFQNVDRPSEFRHGEKGSGVHYLVLVKPK